MAAARHDAPLGIDECGIDLRAADVDGEGDGDLGCCCGHASIMPDRLERHVEGALDRVEGAADALRFAGPRTGLNK
ncbi:hypothetical protein GCM10009573_14390 [Agromyces bracchium]